MRSVEARISLLLFCVAWFAYALMFNGSGNWNTVPRIGLSLALVERGDLFIDEFAPVSGDKGRFGTHIISDKAPGMSFLALPAVLFATKVVHGFYPEARWIIPADDPTNESARARLSPQVMWVEWFAILTTSSLYSALAVVALFRIALLFRLKTQSALFGALVYAFATPTWGWATTFFGHAACGAFLIFALWIIVRETAPETQRSRARTIAAGVAAGFTLGTAVVIEYTAAVPALPIAIYGVWRSVAFAPARTPDAILAALAGALLAGVPLMLYNFSLFGTIFTVSYGYSDWENNREALWGVSWPSAVTALKLLIDREKGLLWLSPILAFVPMAWWSMQKAGERALMILCISVFLSYLILNSGIIDWGGGRSTGPRYMVASLPFMVLPLAWLWESGGLVLRSILAGFTLISGVLCFAMASIQMFYHSADKGVLEALLEGLARAKYKTFHIVPIELGMNPSLVLIIYLGALALGIIALAWAAIGAGASAQTKQADESRLR